MMARRMVWKRRRGFGVAFGEAGLRGEDGGDADEEEEGGEDEVGGGEAVPVGVLHGPVGLVAAAVVVDHDHEADGEAAEDVDGEPAVLLGDGGGAFDGGEDGGLVMGLGDDMLYQGRELLASGKAERALRASEKQVLPRLRQVGMTARKARQWQRQKKGNAG